MIPTLHLSKQKKITARFKEILSLNRLNCIIKCFFFFCFVFFLTSCLFAHWSTLIAAGLTGKLWVINKTVM